MTDPSPPPAVDIDDLLAKHAATTKGEWFLAGESSYSVCVQKEESAVPSKVFSTHAWSKARENCDFAAEIHNAFPAMAAELTALRNDLEVVGNQFKACDKIIDDKQSELTAARTALPERNRQCLELVELIEKLDRMASQILQHGRPEVKPFAREVFDLCEAALGLGGGA